MTEGGKNPPGKAKRLSVSLSTEVLATAQEKLRKRELS